MSKLIQDFLRSRSPNDLFTAHGIRVTPSDDHRVASVNYDQIAAKSSDPMVWGARGLVLRLSGPFDPGTPLGDTRIVGRPFDRFFNHGEGPESHRVDLSDPAARYEEKLDGTLCIVYHDAPDGWHIGTRNVPRADKPAGKHAGDLTFRGLFERTVGGALDTWASKVDPTYTYLFELTGPLNEVFVRHDRPAVTLLGARHTGGGWEMDDDWCMGVASDLRVETPKRYTFPNAEAAFAFIHGQPPRAHEGMVVKVARKDAEGHTYHARTKVKNLAYVAAAHMAGANVAGSPRDVASLILSGAWDDVAPTLNAHIQTVGTEIEGKIRALAEQQDRAYERLATPGIARKDLAKAAGMAGLIMPAVFARYEGRVGGFLEWVMSQRSGTGWKTSLLDSLVTGPR